MVEVALTSPFGDERVDEVALAASPLARVLTQVRFPRLAALAADDAAANRFAAAMRADFPILQEQREVGVVVTPDGVSQSTTGARIWQLRNAEETWQVSFSETFLAIDTAEYASREDFAARVATVWELFAGIVAPPFVERVGVRYINRLTEPGHLTDLPSLVRTEVLGGLGADLGGVRLSHNMSEALYQLGDQDLLQARWGLLPPGAVLDATIPPVPTQSWILDLDSFFIGKTAPDVELITSRVTSLAERAYRYFRWVVTPEFLKTFGGQA